MLYLVSPFKHLRWINMPRSFLEAVEDHGVDLAKLEWLPTEEPHDVEQVLRLALRHGVACSEGIAVDSVLVSTAEHPELLRSTHAAARKASKHPVIARTDEAIEEMAAGWIAAGQKIDREIDESLERVLTEAEAKAARDLEVPIQPALSEHWRMLGGLATWEG